jgi:DNA-binding response OmpR family regulator
MPRGRVLVVDDEPDVAQFLRDALIHFGFEVETALTRNDALVLAPLYRPDVILLDLLMPDMPGHVALERFRELDPTVPVIIISGTQDEEVARATSAMGAFDYVMKPFNVQALKRVVAASLEEHEHRRLRR